MTEAPLDDEERIQLVRTLGSMAMNAELSNTELDFYNYLTEFFEQQAQKHYERGYQAAVREHKWST